MDSRSIFPFWFHATFFVVVSCLALFPSGSAYFEYSCFSLSFYPVTYLFFFPFLSILFPSISLFSFRFVLVAVILCVAFPLSAFILVFLLHWNPFSCDAQFCDVNGLISTYGFRCICHQFNGERSDYVARPTPPLSSAPVFGEPALSFQIVTRPRTIIISTFGQRIKNNRKHWFNRIGIEYLDFINKRTWRRGTTGQNERERGRKVEA